MIIVALMLSTCVMGKTLMDPKLMLAEIDDNHVGKTFLNAIQIGLATGSPIHEI